ncbi:hypothetical protein [Streptomyces sp. P9(2023)]|uniref:hypothetical protein n=1 Tax=Streptomyces sp. P9(2023) TaxID=3064394 RepID=UPI0037DDAC48
MEPIRSAISVASCVDALTGAGVGHRQVAALAIGAAVDIDSFYDALVPAPCTNSTLLVLSLDGKGVVMRPDALREATARAAAAKGGNKLDKRLSAGEKNGRKRMATLGTVYDAEPVPRDIDDIIADADDERATDGADPPARPESPLQTAVRLGHRPRQRAPAEDNESTERRRSAVMVVP